MDDALTLMLKATLSGFVSGAVTKTCVAPLERVKILYQVQDMAGGDARRYTSFTGSLRTIAKDEGIKGFFRGSGANISRILPSYGLKFMFNDSYKRAVAKPGQSLHHLDAWQLLLSGWLAGVSQATLIYPLDIARTRLTLDDRLGGPHRGIIGSLRYAVRTEGPASLFKGYSCTFLSTPVYIGLQMSLYDLIKRRLQQHDTQLGNTMLSFCAGAMAGLIAQTTAYPGDTIRKQLQSNGIGGAEKKYKGLQLHISLLSELVCHFIFKAHGCAHPFLVFE